MRDRLYGIGLGMAFGILIVFTVVFGWCCYAHAFDFDRDNPCPCGMLENGNCHPCPFGLLLGDVVCLEDGSPVEGEPVKIERLIGFERELLTNKNGKYWDFVWSGVFKTTVRDKSKYSVMLPSLWMVDVKKWEVQCQELTTTSTIQQTTTTIPNSTTIKPTTTTIPENTTTVLPITTTMQESTTTTLQPITTTIVTTSISPPPSTSVCPTTTTTTIMKKKKHKC